LESEARQFLCLNAEAQWALRIVAMAPLEFAGSATDVLDAVVLRQAWAQPPVGSLFRMAQECEQIGVVFISDETVRSKEQLPGALHGAHRILLRVPVVFKDPGSALSLWLACTANGAPVTHRLALTLTPRESPGAPAAAAEEGPAVTTPQEGARVGETVPVSGKLTTPGMLVVAWLQEATAQEGQPDQEPEPVRYISRQDGTFHFEVPVAKSVRPGTELLLHVRAESPGYKSPETVRRVVRDGE
jgi:hypothetical protein